MRTLLILAGFIAGFVPQLVAAEDFASHIKVLDRPGQTETITVGSSQAVVTLQQMGDPNDDGAYRLIAVLRCCAQGETLRSKIRLRDGQGYAVILNSENGEIRDSFTFQRAGNSILVTGAALGAPQPVAANVAKPDPRLTASTL